MCEEIQEKETAIQTYQSETERIGTERDRILGEPTDKKIVAVEPFVIMEQKPVILEAAKTKSIKKVCVKNIIK